MATLLREFGSCKPYWETKAITRKIFITNQGKRIVRQLHVDVEKLLNGIQLLMEENNLHYAWISVVYGDLSIDFTHFSEQKKEA